ncbi:hypothetical protein Scep_029790 [Stephania cephalantha]|uniref:RNase H type-1 domain-containing protein n=1 Tax=Stephania cephalantha TaxID=152367 RepID=A0AAP0E613_9MAGN
MLAEQPLSLRELVHVIKAKAWGIQKAFEMFGDGRTRLMMWEERLVGWAPPPNGWVKLNFDGLLRGEGMAVADGLSRNSTGDWVYGFTTNLGICSIFEAELWGCRLAYNKLGTMAVGGC